MSQHLTVRMAWHDNGWNGKICRDPSGNFYCVGNHSLLSDRLRREKNTEIESKYPLTNPNAIPGYEPPCFWSINAFSENEIRVTHKHPFSNLKHIVIEDKLPPYSVFTWPFRLSYNHGKKAQDLYGNYKPRLEETIKRYLENFNQDSIVFFYLNYDNPISGDEYKYALVGCSLLTQIEFPEKWPFTPEELEKIRRPKAMKYFPDLNWTLKIQHDPENCVLLPYQEYANIVKDDPSKQYLIDEAKVLIEDEKIIPHFKYVNSNLEDDACLYLLYKIKRSIETIKEHKIVDIQSQEEIINRLIQKIWKKRGLYPSLGAVLNVILECDDNKGQKIINLIQKNENGEIIDYLFNNLLKYESIPDYLREYNIDLFEARGRLSTKYFNKHSLLKKLSLFNLTTTQIRNIVQQNEESFKRLLAPEEIIENPYLLSEYYVAETPDLDEEIIKDREIDFFTIDVGMFPDRKYIEKNIELQNLLPESPQRLRPIIVKYLQSLENVGDCYAEVEDVHKYIKEHPLFYKDEIYVDPDALTHDNAPYLKYFQKRLYIEKTPEGTFFYLSEIKEAENIIHDTVIDLLSRPEHPSTFPNISGIINQEVKKLNKIIPDFDENQFIEERSKLFNNILQSSFYIISGKPGSGKTHVLNEIINRLRRNGEDALLLAPTGKASLRLKEKTETNSYTIDRFLYQQSYGRYLENFESLLSDPPRQLFRLDNLIIDESSMIDLKKLAILFKILQKQGAHGLKRIIMVGDENQLPPIGYGRPFYDIIEYIKTNENFRDYNYIRLKTNCRQELDNKVLEFADIFTQKNRYYEPLFEELLTEGKLSEGFQLQKWKTEDELTLLIQEKLLEVFEVEKTIGDNIEESLNLLYGCYENGYVKMNEIWSLKLDRFQILSPYRANHYGTLGLNEFIKREYKSINPHDYRVTGTSSFNHSDKIIRMNNWYGWWRGKRDLILSNGSIGIINNKQNRYQKWKREHHYYFKDLDTPLWYIDDPGNFELAYAITVHKSQGSDFKNVFLVLPRKPSLLSKELLYTALTRSTHRIFLFLEDSEDVTPLAYAKNKSNILKRNTSLFTKPQNTKRIYTPDPGIEVKSKIEYIIYNALKLARDQGILDFAYEETMKLPDEKYDIHPDFTIWIGDRTYYWEHLGILDMKDYYTKWMQRKETYKKQGLYEQLVTTDDLNGINSNKIQAIIEMLLSGNLKPNLPERFSKYHFTLS